MTPWLRNTIVVTERALETYKLTALDLIKESAKAFYPNKTKIWGDKLMANMIVFEEVDNG